MTVSVNETEAKYDAPAGVAVPSLDGLPGVAGSVGPQEQELKAEYFDTEDLRLIRAGITLRRRTGGSDAGWHLKLPAGPQSRTEIRLPLGRAVRRVPAELADLVRGRIRALPLLPVATLTTRRQVTTLVDASGKSLAEIADDTVSGTRHGDPASDSHWRELEVELTGGDRRLLRAADEVLRREGLHPAGYSAKLERVLGRSLAPPADEPRLSRSSPASQVVAAYLGKQAEALASLDPMVRQDEPDAVHQMRVATRRLRSTLRTFAQVISGDETTHLAEELQWLGRVLGEARDAEVQAGRLQEQVAGTDAELLLGPVAARVQAHFAKTAAQARAGVLAALNSERYYSLLDALDAVIDRPAPGPDAQARAGRVLPAAVGRSYRKTRRRIRSAVLAPDGQPGDVALHQARKAAKQARYAAEVAEPAVGRDAAAFARRMKEVQSALGDHQDSVVSRDVVRRLGIEAQAAGEIAFSYGLFYGNEACDAHRLRARALRKWHHASRPRYRRWMSA
jgi:CHAD domain-containing protein